MALKRNYAFRPSWRPRKSLQKNVVSHMSSGFSGDGDEGEESPKTEETPHKNLICKTAKTVPKGPSDQKNGTKQERFSLAVGIFFHKIKTLQILFGSPKWRHKNDSHEIYAPPRLRSWLPQKGRGCTWKKCGCLKKQYRQKGIFLYSRKFSFLTSESLYHLKFYFYALCKPLPIKVVILISRYL